MLPFAAPIEAAQGCRTLLVGLASLAPFRRQGRSALKGAKGVEESVPCVYWDLGGPWRNVKRSIDHQGYSVDWLKSRSSSSSQELCLAYAEDVVKSAAFAVL